MESHSRNPAVIEKENRIEATLGDEVK